MDTIIRQNGRTPGIADRIKRFILKNRRIGYFQVLYTPRRISACMFSMCILFALIGAVISYEYDKFKSVEFEYQDCRDKATEILSKPEDSASKSIHSWSWDGTTCKIWFVVPYKMDPPVFIYYGLTEFYQNHHRYISSYDARQLKGEYVEDAKDLNSDCGALIYPDERIGEGGSNKVKVGQTTYDLAQNAQIYPCGLKANSMFSDEISDDLICIEGDPDQSGNAICSRASDSVVLYSFSEKKTAPADHAELYGNIDWKKHFSSEVTFARTIVPPPLWRISWKKWRNGYTFDNSPKLGNWERFQSWMDSAGLPEFWKLWGINHVEPLMPGIWELSIEDNFGANSFKGTKSIIITTSTSLGARNEFLRRAYFICSGVFGLTGIFISLRSLIFPHKYSEVSLIEETPTT